MFPALAVSGCAGSVLIENCRLVGGNAPPGLGAMSGARVTGSPGGVELVRSTVVGGIGFGFAPGFWGPTQGAPALRVGGSRVELHGSILRGGAGGFGSSRTGCIFVGCSSGASGGAAVQALDGVELVVVGSELVGGDSGYGFGPGTLPGTDGIDAIEGPAATDIRVRDSVLVGGAGGQGDVSTGAPGAAYDQAITPAFQPGPATSVSIEAPRRVGQSAALHLCGVPGALCFLYSSPQSASRAILAASLPLFLDEPIYLTSVSVVLGSSGEADVFVPMPMIGADEGRTSFCQALLLDLPLGAVDLSSPTLAVVLSSSF
jgi:hypothetical protein